MSSFTSIISEVISSTISCLRSSIAAFFNKSVQKQYWKHFTIVALVLTIVLIILVVVLAPLLPILIFYAPGVILQILVFAGYVSRSIVNLFAPLSSCSLFLAHMKSIDMNYGLELEAKVAQTKQPPFFARLWEGLKKSLMFLLLSLALVLVGVIPVVGSIISAIGEVWLVTQQLSWQFLDPYMQNAMAMNHEQRKHFVLKYNIPVFGFALPWAVIISIPLVGPILTGFGQAGFAQLFYDVIKPREDSENRFRQQQQEQQQQQQQSQQQQPQQQQQIQDQQQNFGFNNASNFTLPDHSMDLDDDFQHQQNQQQQSNLLGDYK